MSVFERRRRSAVATALLGLAVALPAQALPQSFSASYTATARSIPVGRVELDLEREDGRYRYRSEMEATGLLGLFRPEQIREVSTGSLAAGAVRPERYDYRRSGSETRTDLVDFTAGGEAAMLRYKGDTRTALLPDEALDPLSLQIALMRDVARGERRLRYLIAEPKRLQAYELAVVGPELIELEGETREAVRVDLVGRRKLALDSGFDLQSDPIPAVQDAERTSFWLLPEQDYLVGRIRHADSEDGTFVVTLDKVHALQPAPMTAGR